jgi:LytS/YehU family sensor histidine kinase
LREFVLPIRTTDTPRLENLLHRGVRLVVPVRIASGEFRYGLLTGRQGGQPYLSEDLDVVASLAAVVSERIDQLRSAEMQRLVSEAELRALQSQINPHFLFNALNTLYGVVPREAAAARKLVLDLADMFRYFLRTERAFVPLADEIRIVRAYLAIEQARLGAKLQTSIDVEDSLLHEMIPVLSIQPLVENAVKHGAAAHPRGCSVQVEVRREEKGLLVRVRDTGPGFGSRSAWKSAGTGVGLANVSRRLSLCYGDANPLHIESDATGTCVSFAVTTAGSTALATPYGAR